MDLYNIQYNDVIVSPHYYDSLKENEILVKSIFLTLQGEGPFAGRPAVFVRMAGCNRGNKELMGCEWCDTDFRVATGVILTFKEIYNKIYQEFSKVYYISDGTRPLVVITGGEPMIQNNLTSLCEYLYDRNYLIQIESNGDRLINDWFAKIYNTTKAVLVVSPKVSPNKLTYERLNFNVFTAIDYLKFVVDAREDSSYHNIPDYAYEWAKMRTSKAIYLSPLTVYQRPVREKEVASFWTDGLIDRELTKDNYLYAAELCIRYGYSLSIQKHLFLNLE